MRVIAISLGAAAVLGAAILWSPLPPGLLGAQASAPPSRPAAAAALAQPGAIRPSRAAGFVAFAPEAAGASANPGTPVLAGVVGSAPRRVAYLLVAGRTVRAGLWDKVGPWRVTAIGARGVRLGGANPGGPTQ